MAQVGELIHSCISHGKEKHNGKKFVVSKEIPVAHDTIR